MAKSVKLEELENLLVDLLNCTKNELKDESGPNELNNWDSITHMEMISKIEDKFDIQLNVDEINQIDTIGALKKILIEHGIKL